MVAMPSTNPSGRAAAIRAIAGWLRGGGFPARSLPPESPLALEIVQGVMRNLAALDFAIAPLCRRRPSPAARAALLAGAWQLLVAGDIPDYAAVSETVSAARAMPGVMPGFVNGVLRNILRSRDRILGDISRAPLEVRTSFPGELVARWRRDFGDDTARELCEAGRGIPPTTVFPLPFSDTSASLAILADFAAAGAACAGKAASGGIAVPRGIPVAGLPGYAEGRFIVQDAATLTPIELLGPKPGESVLDLCAAPGGKTMQIAALVGEAGHVVALDASARRLGRLRENLRRTHLSGRVETAVCDASSPDLARIAGGRRFDAILADVPCSNSGVMARRPDARWRWSADEVARLARLQLSILENAAALGAARIVYSTCSIDPVEDAGVVAAFSATPAGAAYAHAASKLSLPVSHGYAFERDGRFLPPDWRDGAFAALFTLRNK